MEPLRNARSAPPRATATAQPETPFASLLRGAAARSPRAPYLVFEGVTDDYAHAAAASGALAGALEEDGVGAGDAVLVLLGNCPSAVYALFACWLRGAVAVPANPEQTGDDLTYQLRHAAVRCVLTTEALRERFAAPLGAAGVSVRVLGERLEAPVGSGLPDAARPAPGDGGAERAALIMYTSGSTGLPKGVTLSQRNLLGMARSITGHYAFSAEDRVLTVLPLFFVNPIVVSLLVALTAGGSVVLERGFGPLGAARLWQTAADHGATVLSGVPSVFATALRLGSTLGREVGPRLRLCVCGGAGPSEALVAGFAERFGAHIADNYGLTETTTWATMPPLEVGRRRRGSAGCAVDCEVRVVGEDGRPLAAGAVGQVVIRGPNLMLGYHRDPELTGRRIVDGWLRTGDLGTLDADGFLFVTGRMDDLIIRRGINIYPREIDRIVSAHPAVTESLTVGSPSELEGEEPVTFVVLKEAGGASAAELLAFARARLAPSRWPRAIRLVDDLPKTPNGKVSARRVRELLGV